MRLPCDFLNLSKRILSLAQSNPCACSVASVGLFRYISRLTLPHHFAYSDESFTYSTCSQTQLQKLVT